MFKSVEEAQAAIDEISATAEERSLSSDEIELFESAETFLRSAAKTVEIQERARNLNTVQTIHVARKAGGEDTIERAFEDYMRTGVANADITELRAQSTGTGSAGGYLVPEGFLAKITETMKAFGGLANKANQITTDSGNPLPWITNDDTSNTAVTAAEGSAAATGADLTFGQKTLGAYKYASTGASGSPLRVSVEMLQDSSIDINGLVTRKLGQRIARALAPHLVSGTGVGQPLGLLTGVTGVEMSSGGPTYNDLIDIIHSLDPAYREMGNAAWLFNDSTLKVLRKLEDSNGDPLWKGVADTMATGLGGGTLLGYPVVIDQAVGDIVSSSGADDNWCAFGDFHLGYVLRQVRGVVVNVNPYARMNEGQVEFSAWARYDATQDDTSAYVAGAGYTA